MHYRIGVSPGSRDGEACYWYGGRGHRAPERRLWWGVVEAHALPPGHRRPRLAGEAGSRSQALIRPLFRVEGVVQRCLGRVGACVNDYGGHSHERAFCWQPAVYTNLLIPSGARSCRATQVSACLILRMSIFITRTGPHVASASGPCGPTDHDAAARIGGRIALGLMPGCNLLCGSPLV